MSLPSLDSLNQGWRAKLHHLGPEHLFVSRFSRPERMGPSIVVPASAAMKWGSTAMASVSEASATGEPITPVAETNLTSSIDLKCSAGSENLLS